MMPALGVRARSVPGFTPRGSAPEVCARGLRPVHARGLRPGSAHGVNGRESAPGVNARGSAPEVCAQAPRPWSADPGSRQRGFVSYTLIHARVHSDRRHVRVHVHS